MANGFGSLYIGASGLQSAQSALNTTANNLANVDTTGYVRQQVIFSDKSYTTIKTNTPTTNMQQTGLGVSIGDVVHARDVFLDKAYRLENGRQAFYESCFTTVDQVQDLFQELNGQEFKQSIEDLSTAFQELAKSPADSVNQNLVIQKCELFVTRSQGIYSDLQSYQSNMNEQIKEGVERVNEIGNRIYELNLYIEKVEAGGIETAMTARDERDSLLDELSTYGKVSIREDQYGFDFVDFQDTEFVVESGCYNIGLQADNGTGFYTPYWPQLSDVPREEYYPVFNLEGEISSELNTDIGSLKALLLARGDGYGRYSDMTTSEAYSKIADSTMMETEAQVDLLFHTVITTMNDLFCPNGEARDLLKFDGSEGTVWSDSKGVGYLLMTDDDGNEYRIYEDTKLLDTANANVGSDGKLPPQELFTRVGCDRYTTVYDENGKAYYLYNEEDPNDSSTMYQLGSVSVNQNLLHQESLLAVTTQNGEIDYALGADIIAAWEYQGMTITPDDNSPCTFEEYYNKLIGELGTDGNVFSSESDTLSASVTSLDNQRLQVTGVSSDEELTNMIRYQAAYNAASRYITVISEMTELIVTGLI
jgi:flagellar hook-associated protein 1 FlgK